MRGEALPQRCNALQCLHLQLGDGFTQLVPLVRLGEPLAQLPIILLSLGPREEKLIEQGADLHI